MRSPGNAVLFLLLSAVACDRMPADPLESDAVAALSNVTGERPAPYTLSGLVYTSVRTVHSEQGSDAALALIRGLARIEQRLDVDSVNVDALRNELRAEQLRIVLMVQGSQAIERTAARIEQEAAQLALRIDASGTSNGNNSESGTVLDSISTLLLRARAAVDGAQALDAATRAGAILDRLRLDVADAARLPTLADLARDAAVRSDSLPSLAVEYQRLVDDATIAVQSGESEQTEDAVMAARAAQINIVLAGLGQDAVTDMIARARERAAHIAPVLSDFEKSRDAARLERMNATAIDMVSRAEVHLRDGDAERALDLAAHATDLLNALDAALITR